MRDQERAQRVECGLPVRGWRGLDAGRLPERARECAELRGKVGVVHAHELEAQAVAIRLADQECLADAAAPVHRDELRARRLERRFELRPLRLSAHEVHCCN